MRQMMTFEHLNLNQRIYDAIISCGYRKPTPIQARAIPVILTGKDLVASAQTGTGKTAAFILPALQKIMDAKQSENPKKNQKTKAHTARVLVLTPTRELANQIIKDIKRYGKFLRLNVAHLIGGVSYHQQIKDLSRPLDIIVATPGRLLDHIERNRVDLANIEMFILDEADRMLDMGFIDDVYNIANRIKADRQTLLFSATIDKNLTPIIRKLLKDPSRIDLSEECISPTKIQQSVYIAKSNGHKMALFQEFLQNNNIFKAIIFSATKLNADRLANTLVAKGLKAEALHGDLRQSRRNRVIDKMRLGKIQYLVATDVAARGIDISDVSHVINFDLPRACEDYIHRIGRTGRAGRSGIAVSFVIPAETRQLQRIERYTNQKLIRENEEQNLTPNDNHDQQNSNPGSATKNKHHSRKRHSERKESQNQNRYQQQPPLKKAKKHRKRNDKNRSDQYGEHNRSNHTNANARSTAKSNTNFSRFKNKNQRSRSAKVVNA